MVLVDGRKVVVEANGSHTVGEVRQHIARYAPCWPSLVAVTDFSIFPSISNVSVHAFRLYTAYPRKELANDELLVDKASLFGGQVNQTTV